MRHSTFAAAALAGLSCTAQPVPAPELARVAQPVIYGDDDRAEPWELEQSAWLRTAVARAVALVPASPAPLHIADEDAAVPSVRERHRLCPEERFAEQQSVADCSGVLIASDLVLTAGHCFMSEEGCDRYAYLFGYVNESDDAGVAEPLVAACDELVVREVGQLSDGRPIDYALVRLAYPFEPSTEWEPPARDNVVMPGAEVSTVGFPVGLPLKVDPNGEVTRVDRTGFELTTDTYVGSSGSVSCPADLSRSCLA